MDVICFCLFLSLILLYLNRFFFTFKWPHDRASIVFTRALFRITLERLRKKDGLLLRCSAEDLSEADVLAEFLWQLLNDCINFGHVQKLSIR